MDSLTTEVAGLVEVAVLLRLSRLGDRGDDLEYRSLRWALFGREIEREGSSGSSVPKRLTRMGTRTANSLRRAGPVTSTCATAARPTSASSRLRSRVSRRTAPHHMPARRSAQARRSTRAPPAASASAPSVAAAGPSNSAAWVSRRRRASARPTQRAAARACAAGIRSRARASTPGVRHRSTSGSSCSRVAGPIPGTASSSSTD